MLPVKVGWKIFGVIIWMSLVFSLALWWMTFSVGLLDRVATSSVALDFELKGARNMLVWEGWFWMLLLLIGGVTLIYFIFRDKKQAEQIKGFLATFSHELKTSLAGVSLQSEALQEDLAGTSHEKLAGRLVRDARRLQMQLENTLLLAKNPVEDLYIEGLSLPDFVSDIAGLWPKVKIKLTGQSNIRTDRRILDGIVKNLVQNAVIHGKATEVSLDLKYQTKSQNYQLTVSDNGEGFEGDLRRLGEFYYRHTARSGSGVGIYTVKSLLNHVSGELVFERGFNQGLKAVVTMEAP